MKINELSPAYKKLVKAAQKAKGLSYSPYSKFRVGAALLTKSGKVILGSNIENSSYGLSICAERTALFKAKLDKITSLKAIAITTDVDALVSPCGACRQVIMELAGDVDVIMSNDRGEVAIMKASALLPSAFTPEMLI